MPEFAAQRSKIRNSASAEALAREEADFDSRLVEPTTARRSAGIVKPYLTTEYCDGGDEEPAPLPSRELALIADPVPQPHDGRLKFAQLQDPTLAGAQRPDHVHFQISLGWSTRFTHSRTLMKIFVEISIVVPYTWLRGKKKLALMNIHKNFFVDPEALSFVRFENMQQDPTAILRFKDGSSETVSGEAASRLQERLNSEHEPREQPEQERPEVTAKPYEFTIELPPWPEEYTRRKKGWFYRKEADGREHFLAFVNAKGSCSLRTFNAQNGIFRGKQYRSGDYQDNFAALIQGASELTIHNQPNLERDCSERLPEDVLAELKSQIA